MSALIGRPANWQEGEDAMQPTPEGVASYLVTLSG